MKYLNFRSSGSKLEGIKSHSVTGVFQRISLQVQNSDIEKCILMASSEDNFNFENFLNGCFSKAAAKIHLSQKFKLYQEYSQLHIVFISYCDVMLKRNEFLWIFIRQGFREKCEHSEIASNIIQKQYILVQKTHFPFIIVEQQHRESAKSCF